MATIKLPPGRVRAPRGFFNSCHKKPGALHPVASSTQNVRPSFFVFSADGRKSKPPAVRVVVDEYILLELVSKPRIRLKGPAFGGTSFLILSI